MKMWHNLLLDKKNHCCISSTVKTNKVENNFPNESTDLPVWFRMCFDGNKKFIVELSLKEEN